MTYWEKRLSDISYSIYDEGTERANKRYREIFDIAAEQIDHDVTALYERMQRDGEITPLSIYKQKRYQNLKKSIKSMANNLGIELEKETQKVLEDTVTEAYEQTGKSLNIKFDKIKKEFIDSIVDGKWSGEMFSKRIWNNVSTLAQQIEKNVVQAVIVGRNKDECVKEVMKRFGVSFSSSDRLVRTEVMYSVNSAQGNIYQQAGYTEYRILVAHDERLCDICGKMVDKEFPFSKKEVGVNYPPFHPRCRCTIVPVIEDNVLTEEEEGALRKYISPDSYGLNFNLRHGIIEDEDRPWIELLDRALEKLPVYKGEVHRSIDINGFEDMDAYLNMHQVGETIIYPAYTSASAGITYDETMKIQLIIESKTGRDARVYNPNEQEIIFRRNTDFKVVKRKGYTIWLVEK